MKKRTSGSVAVCIIVENLPVPADRRVWREARALVEAGYHVSIICPKGAGFEESHEILDEVEIYRHSHHESNGTMWGYIREYGHALIVEFLLACRIFCGSRFRILQACNPPDTLFLIALVFKLVGVRFIFDYHDPSPELFALKYSQSHILYRLVCLAERLSCRTADVVMTTNESGRETAIQRGGALPGSTFVVRTCPELDEIHPELLDPELKEGLQHLVIYVGVMGPQDGLDLLLESISYLVTEQSRRDILFALIGPGSEVPRLKKAVKAKSIEPWVRFPGPLYGDDLGKYLATAEVGVAPDPLNPLNNKLTMIKIFEYMAYTIPVVLYDLAEGRRSAANAALYATPNDPVDFAQQIAKLLDSESLRKELGGAGKRRIYEGGLNWGVEQVTLLKAYQTALPKVTSLLAVDKATCEEQRTAAQGEQHSC